MSSQRPAHLILGSTLSETDNDYRYNYSVNYEATETDRRVCCSPTTLAAAGQSGPHATRAYFDSPPFLPVQTERRQAGVTEGLARARGTRACEYFAIIILANSTPRSLAPCCVVGTRQASIAS